MVAVGKTTQVGNMGDGLFGIDDPLPGGNQPQALNIVVRRQACGLLNLALQRALTEVELVTQRLPIDLLKAVLLQKSEQLMQLIFCLLYLVWLCVCSSCWQAIFINSWKKQASCQPLPNAIPPAGCVLKSCWIKVLHCSLVCGSSQ